MMFTEQDTYARGMGGDNTIQLPLLLLQGLVLLPHTE